MRTRPSPLTSASRRTYKWAINKYVKPYIGERKISELDALDIDELLSLLQKKQCSTRTIKAVYVTLLAALNFAVQRRIIPANPINGIKTPTSREEDRATHARAGTALPRSGERRSAVRALRARAYMRAATRRTLRPEVVRRGLLRGTPRRAPASGRAGRRPRPL